MKVEELKTVVSPLCRTLNVRRLDVFGSVARGTSASSSDIDLIVEFNYPDQDPSKRFFGLLHQLEDSLGCRIDLLTIHGLRNPYIKNQILSERIPVYEG